MIAGLFAYLYLQEAGVYSNLFSSYNTLKSNNTALQTASANLKANYDTLMSKLSTANSNYASLSSNYATLSDKYNSSRYNLTHPDVQTFYSDKTVNVPPEKSKTYYNMTYYQNYVQYIQGQYVFSFNAPYDGYVTFNESNTGTQNNSTSAGLIVWISTEEPYNVSTASGAAYQTLSSFVAPYVNSASASGQTAIIPVSNGTNYVIFNNYNLNQGITVTFSMKYVGFHTS